MILNTVLYHHECLNGADYPCGLKVDNIPLESRIWTVADAWDALVSNRCYYKAWDKERVLEFIRTEAGTQFDPDVVSLFLRTIEHQELIKLNNFRVHPAHFLGRYKQLARVID